MPFIFIIKILGECDKMKKSTKLSILCGLTLCAVFYNAVEVFAEENVKNFSLSEYVVTANRTEQKVIDANANISVVTREDIERMQYADIDEALRSVPGVQFQNYSGGQTNPNMYSIRINGSQRVLVLVDGIRVNPIGGSEYAVNLSLLNNMDNIERIEVLKGAAGTLYGSDAVGGVINIITRKIDSNKTTYKTSAGSFGKITHSFYNQGIIEDDKSGNKFSYNVYYNENRSSNYKDGKGKDVFNNFEGKNAGVKIIDEIGKHNFTLQYDESDSDFSALNMYNKKPSKQFGHTSNKALTFTHDFDIDDSLNNKFVFRKAENMLHWAEDFGGSWGPSVMAPMDYRNTTISDQLSKKFNEYNDVIIGFEHTKTETGGFYDDDKNIETDNIDWDCGEAKINSYFIHHNWKITDKWQLTSGLRYDKANLEYVNTWSSDRERSSRDMDSNLSKSMNLSYKFDDNRNIYFDYHDYFVIPTAYQVANPDYGNAYLEPAKGKYYGLGYNHIFDDTTQMSTHVFLRDGEDIKLADSQYKTFNNTKDMGFDIQLNKQIGNNWNTYIGYSYLHHKSDYSAQTDRVKLGYLPKHALNIGVTYAENKFDAGLNVRAVLDRDGENPYIGNTGHKYFESEHYWVVDLAANYKPTKNIKLFATVNNLFDTFYEDSALQKYNPDNEFNYYPMQGRNFVVGAEFSF